MIKNLIHLSDIHIRNGDINYSRFNEYKNVFNNLFESINNYISNYKLKKDEYLIIITGDIFHNKNNIGNYGLMLYKILIENLTKIGLTIILEGNHDSIQHELNQPSLVTSTIGIDNLIILNESKSFIIDDIGFSYVNIRDTLDNFSNSGRKNILKPFPIINKPVKYKIALFHGTFANIKLYNGTNITSDSNPYPFEWIKDFDLALLGDIHLRQKNTYKKNLLWCYSGSLIQQNFGEDIIEHGYVIWNLEKKKIYDVNVLNNCGKINLKEENNKILFRKTNKFYDLDEYIYNNINLFPKNLEIKFLSSFNYDNFQNIMNKYNIKYNIINNNTNNFINNKKSYLFDNNNYNEINKENMITYFENHLEKTQYKILLDIFKDYDKLLFDIDNYPKELKDECFKKNKELSYYINICKLSEDYINTTCNFTIKYLEWNNLFCYTNNNIINFQNLLNSTFIISGKNGIGKSAIYDILTLALWGEITKKKQNEITSGIINYNSDIGSTNIEFYSNNELYKINRKFVKRKDNPLLIKITTELYKYENNNFILLKKDTASKEYIIKLIGNIETFLSSSMITQNIDFDILKMNFKDCTEIIDKATNIQYIYNLYSLFKNVLNKYKDFKKIIISKKNVFNELINTFNNNFSTEFISQHYNELDILNIKKKELNNKLNLLTVNIDKDIIFINYETMIEKLGEINIKSKEEYDKIIENFNELKFFFKNYNIDENEIMNLYSKYDKTLITDYDIIINKPCDLSILENEKKLLEKYKNFVNLYLDDNIDSLNNKLKYYKNEYDKYLIELNIINNKKPLYSDKPLFDYNDIIKNIHFLFNDIDLFLHYYNNNIKLNINDDIEIFDNITYNTILNNKIKQKILLNRIHDFNNKISIIDKNIKNYMKLLNNMNVISKPDITIKLKNSSSITKYITNIKDFNDINELLNYNNKNIEVVNNYNNKKDEINTISIKIKEYENELELFNNNHEYKYDPNCIYCCKRPWVIKISELKDKIKELNSKIYSIQNFIKINFKDINYIIKQYDNNIKIIDKYNLYNEWLSYCIYIENKKNLEINIQTYENYKSLLDNDNKNLNNLKNINDKFSNLCYNLFNKYTEYNNYIKYTEWFNKYTIINNNCIDIKNNIDNLNNHIDFFNNIKPRIDNYNKINNNYNLWYDAFNNLSIYNAYKYISFKKNIYNYELYLKYTNNIILQKNMLEKININKLINDLDNEINNKKTIITEYNTTKSINDTNLNSFNKLLEIENNINNIINIINIIIDKFKDYRKWLYNNIILNNIILNTNNFIQELCHNDTKMFELDYILTENKDIIHINWLIKNKDNFNNSQTISINQASGFQHFVISIALRLSLFNNKHCDQLFIDEGFTSCDKNNLSIVPMFLKNLLKIFNTIIIVSHIDLIQDSIDEKIEIKFNNNDKSSNIKFL